MTPQETFNAMMRGDLVRLKNNENTFTIYCIYSDNIVSLMQDNGELISDVNCSKLSVFFYSFFAENNNLNLTLWKQQ